MTLEEFHTTHKGHNTERMEVPLVAESRGSQGIVWPTNDVMLVMVCHICKQFIEYDRMVGS